MTEPVENLVLTDIADLHRAMYLKMQTGMAGVSGLEFVGFDSSHENPVLPKVGIKISLAELAVDRMRPTPLEGNRLEVPSGEEIVNYYDNEAFTGTEEKTLKYPLPVSLIYSFDCWCYSAEQQLQIDQALLQTFPERGVLTLQIDDEDFDFPIEMTGVQDLDDLQNAFRERIYRFRVEAWIRGSLPDETRKIIQTSETQVRFGDAEDINLPGGQETALTLTAEPDEE